MVLLVVTVEYRWRTILAAVNTTEVVGNIINRPLGISQGILRGDRVIEVKITVIEGDKFRVSDNRPLITVPLHTGSTVVSAFNQD